jgi:hypothetical protein
MSDVYFFLILKGVEHWRAILAVIECAVWLSIPVLWCVAIGQLWESAKGWPLRY